MRHEMTAVKGSKQFEMVVVRHRPWLRPVTIGLAVTTLVAFTWSAYDFGFNHGIATGAQAVRDRDRANRELSQSEKLIKAQQQQIADLKVGNQVDTKANQDVRQTIASLQGKVADLNEQISFYKAVMSPSADEMGLHIYRLDLKTTDQPGKYHYNLLLTHIFNKRGVNRHNYIEGRVSMSVVGMKGNEQTSIPIDKLSTDDADNYRFRFKYFQNIDGDLTIPAGFTPTQLVVIAQARGKDATRLEKKFQWHTDEG